MSNVYLVTTGDGSDGDEWNVHGIFATKEAADNFVREASRNCCYEVEEWGVEQSLLTDAEREAVDGAVWDYGQYADEMGLSVAEVTERQNTLRSLLERMK